MKTAVRQAPHESWLNGMRVNFLSADAADAEHPLASITGWPDTNKAFHGWPDASHLLPVARAAELAPSNGVIVVNGRSACDSLPVAVEPLHELLVVLQLALAERGGVEDLPKDKLTCVNARLFLSLPPSHGEGSRSKGTCASTCW
jgi:hypothetical protein